MMNPIRDGKFTSSTISDLMTKNRKGDGFGAPGLRLIQKVKYETKLGRSLDSEISSKPCNWGKLVEKRVQTMLPFDRNYQSIETLTHPTITSWAGTPDYVGPGIVGDIKCPWTLLSYVELYEAIDQGVDALKKHSPEYYWQLVSNAILTNSTHAELTIYCPYQDELEEIRNLARNQEQDQQRYAFINYALDDDLPYLIRGNHYQNIKQIAFEVPQSDKSELEHAVQLATINISL